MKTTFLRRGLTVLIAGVIGAAAMTGSADADSARWKPDVVAQWAAAWNGGDPQALAKLFTHDATYTDYGVNKVSTGRDGVAAWKYGTDQLIADVRITVKSSFRGGDRIAVETIYAGHIKGAPTPFAVPTTTILELRGTLISADRDYYSLATLLAQSGLPADWTPPTA
ncbi:nuclear transport factor 2 family protein [Umezawaea sp. Da 62-37]|uniref:nuclear transport factor 2 family protein n=1 Tax=Umezawaea sp. Da 62-37 TaxID=3075927 RepID=UPI0028F748D1|nr:nuclear transport factor 2 family protein [Umezawaea sp. Da 62-37]WNV90468.1 nuclear transport factor 2 family protein [Umezawaea sp. Da 62-37]